MKIKLVIGFVLMLGAITGYGSPAITDAIKLRIQNGSYYDETVIRFLPGCTGGYNNGYDAQKLFSPSAVPSIYTKDDAGTPLAINALADLESDQSVLVFVRIPAAGNYSISSTIPGQFGPGVVIILEDISTGIKTNIQTQQYIASFQIPHNSSLPSFILHFYLPPKVIEFAEPSCTGSAGMFVFHKAASQSLPYKLMNASGDLIASSMTSSGSDTIQGLPSGSFSLRVFQVDSIYTEASISLGLSGQPVANFETDVPNGVVGQFIQFTSLSQSFQDLEWHFGNGDIMQGDTSRSYVYHAPGVYAVDLIAINGACSDTIQKQIEISSITGISEVDHFNIKVKLNGSVVFIESSGMLGVYGLDSRLIHHQRIIDQKEIILDLPLQTGMYLVASGKETKRVFID